ncbi:MAG TPA: HAMP domain-containing sensor histidine kinase [Streptosporangiaceae bacterium]|jgi:two-component system OmpR family sensor kinase|nr:HAMP domain-containing sensor histidine kinase [Streptosporangiaceae bacterium]
MKRPLRWSLRARLLAGLIGVTAMFLLIMGTVSTFVMSSHLDAQFNNSLLAALGRSSSELKDTPAYAIAIVTPPDKVMSYDNGSPDAARLAAGLRKIPLVPLIQYTRTRQIFAIPGAGTPLAAAARHTVPPPGARHVGHQAADADILVVAEPRGRVVAEVRSLIVTELITGCVLLAVLAVGGRWLIGRGLAPLHQMATTAKQITTRGDLTARMPVPSDHAEVGRLADAINTMLNRIEQAFGARLHSEQKVRQFAADASHELRTPLTTIRGYAELYGQGALGPDQLPNAMRRIDEESQRMSRLVTKLLELARLDRTSSLDLSRTDLALLVRDAVADASAVEPGRPVRMETPEQLMISADEPRIRQILANLLANVREHTPPETPVTVRLAQAGEGALIEVADAGPGMGAEDAARAFDRFYRGKHDPDAVAGEAGSGLGLSIVQAIATAHNGHADLLSAPGRGTRVRVWLPARMDP